MPYGVHIRRQESKLDDDAKITLAEWTDLIEYDDSLEIHPYIEIKNPETRETIRKDGPGIAAWRGHPEIETVWFTLSEGEIALGSPDAAVLNKMIEIAGALRADVQGDEGEIYPLENPVVPSKKERPFWKCW